MAESARKKPVRRRRSAPDDIGNVVVPERFQHVVGQLEGVSLLKALYFLSEGERLGREGSTVADQLREIRTGLVALLSWTQSQAQIAGRAGSIVPFPGTRPLPPSGDAAEPPGLTVEDAEKVRSYARAYSGGDTRLANAAYARVMEDAQRSGVLNSRWQLMVQDRVNDLRDGPGPQPLLPMPDEEPLFSSPHEEPAEPEFEEGV